MLFLTIQMNGVSGVSSTFREEWGKIKRLVAERGKSYKTSKGAREHLATTPSSGLSLLTWRSRLGIKKEN
jgi:hypothetical protein